MKKFLTAALLVAALWSCTETSRDVEIVPEGIDIPALQTDVIDPFGTAAFDIETKGKWAVASNYPSWVSVSPLSGEGAGRVTVTAQPNGTGGERVVRLTVGGGDAPRQVTLRQPASRVECGQSDPILFPPNSTAGFYISVTSNTSWSVEAPPWCVATPASGIGNGTFMIAPAAPGSHPPERVRVAAAGAADEFTVAQMAGASASSPALLYPGNGAAGVSLTPLFQWMRPTGTGVWTAFIGTSPEDISTPLVINPSSGILAASGERLKPSTAYYWRLQCDDGSFSATAKFTTGAGAYRDGDYRWYQQNVRRGAEGEVLEPVNLVIMGDGFVASDYVDGGWFDQLADKTAELLMSAEPVATMRDYFRIAKVCAVSRERGASAGQMMLDTSFGLWIAGGNTFITNTLDDYSKMESYARRVPGIVEGDVLKNTVIICLVNMNLFAGTCSLRTGGPAISRFCIDHSTSISYPRLVIHETIGHGLARLADEYVRDEGTLEGSELTTFLNYQNNYGWYRNVSSSPDTTPWEGLIGPLVGEPGYEAIGAYEGAFVYRHGAWKSEPNSMMASTECDQIYFNAISRYLIYERVLTIAGEAPTLDDFRTVDRAGREQPKPYDFPLAEPSPSPAPYGAAAPLPPEIIND